MIEVTFEGIPLIDVDKQISFVEEIIIGENKSLGDINFIFCSDDYIIKINNDYLDHDYYTDIITFNYNQGDVLFSDIFISIDTVKSNAILYDTTFINELTRVIFHGILHLIGYDDKSDQDVSVMRAKEEFYLDLFHVKHSNVF